MNLRKHNIHKGVIGLMMFGSAMSISAAEVSRIEVETKIEQLEQLIDKVRQKGQDVTREEMTIHTAKLFLDYADFDEANPAKTLEACKASSVYGNQGEKFAALLPNFQREESLAMINEAITILQDVLDGKIIYRKPVPAIDWKTVKQENGVFKTPGGHPVFLGDYTFKPQSERLNKYYGDSEGFHYDFGFLEEDMMLSQWKQEELAEIAAHNTLGSPFLGHGTPSKWMKEKYPGIEVGARLFTKYDIDNPNVRVIWDKILSQTVPPMKGLQCASMGYLLANEPHWHTAAHTWDTPKEDLASAKPGWDTGEVSDYTIKKFKVWLEDTHGDIDDLNKYWKTSYADFDDVKITIPLDNELLGTAIWYDWMKFNQWRCTEWFKFLISTVRKYDPSAVANVKVMPVLWAENTRDHGLDFEAITELSGVIGNDAAASKEKAWGEDGDWKENYMFSWREMSMTFDFFRSISPEKLNYNSESHYTMNTAFQDLYLSKEYTRCAYWLSSILGGDINHSWVWSRKDDESIKDYSVNIGQAGQSHIGSFTTQPRVMNEKTKTLMDLSAHGYDVENLQNMRQPIRIFYSETSALNKREHMDEQFELYEKLFFTGNPIGFVTKNILNKQDHNNWDVVLVKNTEYVTADEINALQSYLDNGGTVIIDRNSLTRSQYMIKHSTALKLKASNGKLLQASTVDDYVDKAMDNMKSTSKTPLEVAETNSKDRNLCFWRAVETKPGRYVMTLTNLGRVDSKVKITMRGKSDAVECRDLMTYQMKKGEITIKPEEVVFIEIGQLDPLSIESTSDNNLYEVYPTLFKNEVNVSGVEKTVEIYNVSGHKIYSESARGTLIINTQSLESGVYFLNIDGEYNKKIVKV